MSSPGASRLLTAVLLILIAAAACIRFHGIESMTFMIDQARDLLYVDGIVRRHELPLLGPLISTGGYLGPAMIYLLLPVRFLSTAPEAFAAFTGLTNIAALLIACHLARRDFGLRAALLTALLVGYNGYAVASSSAVWNPFLVPLFSALLTLALFRFFLDGSEPWLAVIGWNLAILLQLHAATIVLPIGCALLFWILPHPAPRPRMLAWLLLGCGLLLMPLLLFDLGNDFYNSRAMLRGLVETRASGVPLTGRIRGFFTVNVFGSAVFRAAFLLGIALLLLESLRPRREERFRQALLILALPAACLFVATAVLDALPLTPRALQGLIIPSGLVAAVALDEAVRRASLAVSFSPRAADAVVVLAGAVYAAVAVRSVLWHPLASGHGTLKTMREVSAVLVDDAGDRTVLEENVFVCERDSGDASFLEYGRGYAYLLQIASDARQLAANGGPSIYMVSPFIRTPERVLAEIDGVRVYRFDDSSQFARFLLGVPNAMCHRASARPFPFRTG